MMTWLFFAIVILNGLMFIQLMTLVVLIGRHEVQTVGNQYFGLSKKDRLRFQSKLRLQRVFLYPILWILGKTIPFRFSNSSFQFQSIAFPKGTCSPELVRQATEYQPQSHDLFVVTPMRCGTTWMQHLLFQILHRGQGQLVENGQSLYSVSPWIESCRAVPMEQAPLIGDRGGGNDTTPRRIIKTHLPATLCPFSKQARYVYVSRDVAGCLASSHDFLKVAAGNMAPNLEVVKDWFTDPHQMWWGALPDHVAGWYQRHQQNPDCVFFVTFSELKSDLRSVAERINSFLGESALSADELEQIELKCSFEYMREHATSFEMMPPHLFHSQEATLVSGSTRRGNSLPESLRTELEEWYQARLKSLLPGISQSEGTSLLG